jgi:hypothetical protein
MTLRGLAALALAMLLPTTGSGQSAASSTAQTPGAISGTVVDSVTRQPVRGAIVTLGPAVLIGTGTRQLTDDRGRFIFLGLPPASDYTLEAHKSGYLDRSNLVRPRQVMLAPGQWLAEQRLEIIPEGSIAGVVRDERAEPVVGARVRLLALLPIAGRVHPTAGPVTTTDDRGLYRFGSLPEGRYLISVPSVQHAVPAETPARVAAGASAGQAARARPVAAEDTGPPALEMNAGHRLVIGGYVAPPPPEPGARPQAYPATFHPEARELEASTPIVLAAGQEREGIDVQLRPVPTFLVSGRIEPAQGITAGFPLRLLPAGPDDLGFGSEAATTVVEANGRFTFLNVPAGRYSLVLRGLVSSYAFSPRGFEIDRDNVLPPMPGFGRRSGSNLGRVHNAPLGTEYHNTLGDWDPMLWARGDVEVSDRDLTGVTLRLQRPAELHGRILRERSKAVAPTAPLKPAPPDGPVRLEDGIRQTIVSADPAEGALWLGQPSAVMDSDDTFTINGLLPGQYLIRVRGPADAGFSVKSIVWQGADYTHTPFDMTTAASLTGVVITLTDQKQSVAGVVAAAPASGQGTSVIAFPVDPKRWTNYGLQPTLLRSVEVSADGRYEVTLPAGDFYLAAVDGSLARAWIDPGFLKAAARVATRVSLAWGEKTLQDLRVVEVGR